MISLQYIVYTNRTCISHLFDKARCEFMLLAFWCVIKKKKTRKKWACERVMVVVEKEQAMVVRTKQHWLFKGSFLLKHKYITIKHMTNRSFTVLTSVLILYPFLPFTFTDPLCVYFYILHICEIYHQCWIDWTRKGKMFHWTLNTHLMKQQ